MTGLAITLSREWITGAVKLWMGTATMWDETAMWYLTRPRGYKTWVQSQTQNKAQWLAACGHVSASSQSLRFILRLRKTSGACTVFSDLNIQQSIWNSVVCPLTIYVAPLPQTHRYSNNHLVEPRTNWSADSDLCNFVICLFDLILYVPSTIIQLNRGGYSWVEPVLS